LHYPAHVADGMRGWSRRAEPFHVAGNIYFVGTNELAIYLITTPAGHILLDSGLEDSVPVVRANVERLGFHFGDVKILLSSHAHADHVAGHAQVKALTGARVLASAADAAVIRSGGGGPIALDMKWPPTVVDGEVSDGQSVALGGTVLVAHLTPGHTPGATTWTTTVEDGGRRLAVVFFSSATLFAEMPLSGNAEYPQIAADFERSYAFWNAVPCDIPLGPHVAFFGLFAKRDRAARGETPNPFIDPTGWKQTIAAQEANFRRRLADK
jgi:metallo-beta-lactamase class B